MQYQSVVTYKCILVIEPQDATESPHECDMRAWFIAKNHNVPDIRSWSRVWLACQIRKVRYSYKIMQQLAAIEAA